MLPDFEDVFLAGIRISLLAQADDLLIFSLSVRGLQVKLARLEQWCSQNFILVNLVKTIILIFGLQLTGTMPNLPLGFHAACHRDRREIQCQNPDAKKINLT
jgi:hypothetical protein